jgi:Fic family protein
VNDELAATLLMHLRASPAAVSASELVSAVAPASRATVLRRLGQLKEQGLVVSVGRGPSQRWRPVVDAAPANDELVPLTDEGRVVRAQVRRPLIKRTPVGFQASFLDRYVPGETSYLSPALRERLHSLGATEAQRPSGTYARQILDRLLIDLSWSSSRLEGNTYSRLETARLLEDGVRAEGKSMGEAIMILNHKRAIEFLVDSADTLAISDGVIRNVHACLMDGLIGAPEAIGALRTRSVQIEGSSYLPPQLPPLVRSAFERFVAKAAAITDPFEQSFFAMVHLPYIQPFEDGNKRTSRLCANIPLIARNLKPLSFVDVTDRDYLDGVLGVYEYTDVSLLRDVFEWAYERSAARYRAVLDSLGPPDPVRLRYRDALTLLVSSWIIDGDAPAAVLTVADVLPEDRPAVESLARIEIRGLTDGNFARFRITPRQYQAWVQRGRPVP